MESLLNNAEFVADFCDQIEMQRQEAEGRAKKKQKILLCNIAKVQSAREKHGHESEHKFQNFKFELFSIFDPIYGKNYRLLFR